MFRSLQKSVVALDKQYFQLEYLPVKSSETNTSYFFKIKISVRKSSLSIGVNNINVIGAWNTK